MSEHFYIVSMKHTGVYDDYVTLWRPDDRGYTLYLATAGKYTQHAIESSPGYYNDGRGKIAVPCSAVDPLAVEAEHRYEPGAVLRNTSEIWEALKAARYQLPVGKSDGQK